MDVVATQKFELLLPCSKELPVGCRSKQQIYTLALALSRGLLNMWAQIAQLSPSKYSYGRVIGSRCVTGSSLGSRTSGDGGVQR